MKLLQKYSIHKKNIFAKMGCFYKTANFYTVQPVPAPCSINALIRRRIIEGGRSQKEILFSLGNAISGAPTIIGEK